jgi:hypothetical protein
MEPHPEFSGALAGLRVLSVADRTRYKAAVASVQAMGWGYYFPNLLAQRRPGRRAVLVGEEDGSLCLFRWERDDAQARLDLYLPPLPMNGSVLGHCLERANDFNGDRSARVLRIDAKDAEAVAAVGGLRVRERRSQYLFAPAIYADLAGRERHTIRRHVVLVERLPDVEVAPYSAARHAEACRALLARWKENHRDAHGTAGGVGGSLQAIELAGQLPQDDLRGEVVLIDGRLAGFAFGGEIRPGLACSFERKCDNDVRGLSYFQFRSLLLRLRDFELVNDGSDAGRAGLAQLKDSFRPVAMHAEFRATQRRRNRVGVQSESGSDPAAGAPPPPGGPHPDGPDPGVVICSDTSRAITTARYSWPTSASTSASARAAPETGEMAP